MTRWNCYADEYILNEWSSRVCKLSCRCDGVGLGFTTRYLYLVDPEHYAVAQFSGATGTFSTFSWVTTKQKL